MRHLFDGGMSVRRGCGPGQQLHERHIALSIAHTGHLLQWDTCFVRQPAYPFGLVKATYQDVHTRGPGLDEEHVTELVCQACGFTTYLVEGNAWTRKQAERGRFAWLKIGPTSGHEGIVQEAVELHVLHMHGGGEAGMPPETVRRRNVQPSTVLVDGRIEAVDNLHEHFDIGRRATGAQGDRWTRWIVTGAVVDLSESLQHGTIKRRGFAQREDAIDVDDKQTDHWGCPTMRRVRYMDAFTAVASQGQLDACAIVLGATIARLDQFHRLIAVICCDGWCGTCKDSVYEAPVLVAIAPSILDAQLPEVVLHAGLPQAGRVRNRLHLLGDELGVVAV